MWLWKPWGPGTVGHAYNRSTWGVRELKTSLGNAVRARLYKKSNQGWWCTLQSQLLQG